MKKLLFLVALVAASLVGCKSKHPPAPVPDRVVYTPLDSQPKVYQRDTQIVHNAQNPFNRTDLEINIFYSYE